MTIDNDSGGDLSEARHPRRVSVVPRRGRLRGVLMIGVLILGCTGGWLAHDRFASRVGPANDASAATPTSGPLFDPSDRRSRLEIERDTNIEARLNAHPWPQPECLKAVEPCRLWHARLVEGRVERKGRKIDVFVYGSGFEDGGGHATKTPISVIEVDGTKLINATINFTEGGIYGLPNANGERYTIIPLNEQGYALAIEESDMHFGLVDETLAIHLFSGGRWEGSFADAMGAKHEAQGEPRSVWKGGWALIDVPGEGPELLITKRGVMADKPLDTIERYRWNGKVFAPAPMPVAATAGSIPSTGEGSASDVAP